MDSPASPQAAEADAKPELIIPEQPRKGTWNVLKQVALGSGGAPGGPRTWGTNPRLSWVCLSSLWGGTGLSAGVPAGAQDFTGTSLGFPREIPLDEAGRFPCLRTFCCSSTIPVMLPALGMSCSRALSGQAVSCTKMWSLDVKNFWLHLNYWSAGLAVGWTETPPTPCPAFSPLP